MRAKFEALVLLLAAAWLAGCGSCSKEKEPTGEGGLPGKVTLLSAPLEGIQAPPDVLAYGGTGPVEKLLADLSGLATQAGLPVPPLQAQLGLALKAELNLKDEKAVDLRQGIRFAVLNPKVHTAEPVALFFGATSKEAFVAALPDDKKENDEGNAWSYLRFPGSTQAVYINFILGTVVVTRDKTIYPKYRSFLERLALADIDHGAGVVIAVRNLAPIYGQDLEAALGEMKKNARQVLSSVPGADQQIWMVDGLTAGISRWSKELDDVRILADQLPDGLKMEISFQPRAGTELAKSFSDLKGPGTGALLDKLPPDAPFFLWLNVPPARVQAFSDKLAGMTVGAMLKDDPAKQAEYEKAMTDAVAAMGGEWVAAAHAPASGNGLTITSAFTVADAAKAREAQGRLAQVYKEPGAQAYYKKVGLEVDMQPAAYTVGDTPVGVYSTKVAATNTKLAAMGGGLQELLTQHVAIGKEMGVLAIGSDARASIEGLLNGSMKGGLRTAPGPARALKMAAPNALMVLYLAPIDLVRRVRLDGMNPFAQMFAGIESATGIGLSVGSEAGSLKVVLDVPLEQAQKIGQAVQKTKGGF